MIASIPGPSSGEFIWAGGIEDTFVPQARAGHRPLDEYQLIGHYDHWREDLDTAYALGVGALRWGVPWYRVEPIPGEFDWSWTDAVLPYMVNELGITPILDLMHYGCPFWLRREFASDEYPQAVAAYATAFARRYAGLVRWYTPLNEPLVNAMMCGRRGIWPPYLRGNGGYTHIIMQLAKGIVATVRALKAVDPDSIMVHVDAAGLTRAARPDLGPIAREDGESRFVVYDLISGRVSPSDPRFAWLARHGARLDDLLALAAQPVPLDVLGLNFYPQWSTQQVYANRDGRLAYRNVEREGAGFAEMLVTYYNRYRVPIIVTETSARGSDRVRSNWLAESISAVKAVRGAGVPVVGYTWFPIFTMIDWRYRLGRGPLKDYRLELGIYKLGEEGERRWQPTGLEAQLKLYMSRPEEAVGTIATAAPAETTTGHAEGEA